jgi:hypothetical protein
MKSLEVIDLMSWLIWSRSLYILIIMYINDRWNALEKEPLFSLDIKPTWVDLRNHPKGSTLRRWTWALYSIRNPHINIIREACPKPNIRKEWRKTYIYIMKNLNIEWRNV